MRTLAMLTLAAIAAPTLAAACPTATQSATSFTLTDAHLAAPYAFTVTASGNVALPHCGQWAGFTTQTPTVSFFYGGPSSEAQLSLRTSQAGCDPVLLVHAPGRGWYFNDDTSSDTRNSWIHIDLNAGRTDIWAGTFNGHSCTVTFEIN